MATARTRRTKVDNPARGATMVGHLAVSLLMTHNAASWQELRHQDKVELLIRATALGNFELVQALRALLGIEP